MTRYPYQPIDFTGLKTVSLYGRGGKVTVDHFATVPPVGATPSGLLDSLPRLLAADTLRHIAAAIENARVQKRAIIWGLGGHVIKCGLAPILLDLADSGFATAFALNGAAAIHDLEFALAGHSSEDVEAVLPDGSFGSADETGREYNRALALAEKQQIGAGEALCLHTAALADPRFASQSLLVGAARRNLPVTVHIAVGTDTPHAHPAATATAIGHATHYDFRLFATLLRELHQGGVYVNLGSAVVLPEVFLKAVSTVRNLGFPLREFTTVNFDFLQHYRPRVNVVERPHAQAGGKGYSLTGHHEIMVPLLAAILKERAQ